MSLTDAFGPLSTQASHADAIAWVRSSLFARMKGNRYRSPLSIAIMYAAELSAGNVPAKRLRKLEAARESLERLGVDDLQRALDVARSAEKAAPDNATREWAARAVSVLSEIGISKLKSAGPPSSLQPISSPSGVAPAAPAPAPRCETCGALPGRCGPGCDLLKAQRSARAPRALDHCTGCAGPLPCPRGSAEECYSITREVDRVASAALTARISELVMSGMDRSDAEARAMAEVEA